MLCPDDSRVAAFVAGDLRGGARGLVEEHIDDCATCRQLIAGLVREGGGPWRPGTQIGRYIIGERIGRGGMGAVYRGEDSELHRPVALKRLHADDERARDRLLREARAAAQLQHPNVVAVYEVVAGKFPFLAMELVEGVTLTEWLRTERSWRDIVAMIAQAGRGLAAAHARGLVHGDFKPDNILVDSDGRARVADFGLASADATEGGTPTETRVTAIGAGTPAYMAPELVDGELPDAQSDVYAFAVTLYEALHGQHPFAGATAEALWSEMALGRIRRGTRRIPAWLDRAIRRGLATTTVSRWRDMAAFVAAIDRRRSRAIAFAGAALVGSAIASAAWLLAPGGTGDDCARGASLVDDLWNPQVRDTQRARFLALRPKAGPSIDTATQAIDDWATAWQLGRRAACAADEHARIGRIGCLDRDLHELRAQLAVWASPDTDVVDHVVRAASGLPSPEHCVAPPAIAELAPAVRDQVAAVDALVRSGHAKAAKERTIALLVAATATTQSRDLAAALLSIGNTEREIGELERARDTFARASRTAGAAGDDGVMLQSLMNEIAVVLDLGRPRDALELLEVAEAIDARTAQHRNIDIALSRGDALNLAGRPAEAVAVLRPLVPILEARAARERGARVRLGGLYAQLGQALLETDEREAGIADLKLGLAADEAAFGPDHPEVANLLHDLGYAEISVHRFDDARAHIDRAIAIITASYGPHHPMIGESWLAAAKLAMYTGKPDDARAANLRARDALTGILPPDHPSFGAIEANLGEIDRNTDHCKAAIPHYERAVAILEANGKSPKDHALQLSSLGACLADVGEAARARTTMERVLAELTETHATVRWFSEPYAVLADLAFADHHKAEAIELERKAIAALDGIDGPDVAAMRQYEQEQLATFSK